MAWERDGHLKNLHKLKALGPNALNQYANEILATPPPLEGPSDATTAAPPLQQHTAQHSGGTTAAALSTRTSSGAAVPGSARSARSARSALGSSRSDLATSGARSLAVGYDPRGR